MGLSVEFTSDRPHKILINGFGFHFFGAHLSL